MTPTRVASFVITLLIGGRMPFASSSSSSSSSSSTRIASTVPLNPYKMGQLSPVARRPMRTQMHCFALDDDNGEGREWTTATAADAAATCRSNIGMLPRGGADVTGLLQFATPFLSKLSTEIVSPFVSGISSQVVQPILDDPQAFVREQARQAKARQAYYAQYPKRALGLVIMPRRILGVSVTAIVLAEILDKLGILEDPTLARQRIEEAWREAKKIPLNEWQDRAQGLWKRVRQPGGIFHGWSRPKEKLATWEPKHQFAVGVAVGWLFGPFAWAYAIRLSQATGIAYLVAEFSASMKGSSSGGQSLLGRIRTALPEPLSSDGGALDQLENKLENLRITVRKTIRDPTKVITMFHAFLDKYDIDDEVAPSIKFGVVLGLATGILAG